ncbi:hypothetical protein [Sphingomonas flavalba]|uniref:hypothetical protein n=1 Tax=Sphingomonas flavalba TaxID=2559804 RepID=UPI00109DCC5B|nr:hypothetical protein [Sphingomonas flavalba]
MARTQKLKVFRTPIGFHDAYVAAPSQKAALEAWGSDTNLFASGAAERIDDPELTREPLANPGKVIRRLRGTMAEHMAALPKDEARSRKKSKGRSTETSASPPRKAKPAIRKPPPKPKPRPDRQPLTRIEAELAEIEKRHERERSALGRKQAELDRERRALERDQAREHERVERRVAAAREKYDRAMRAWRAD